MCRKSKRNCLYEFCKSCFKANFRTVKKAKRRKRTGPNDATLTTGISRLLATVQASANSVGMLPDPRKNKNRALVRKNNSISDSLGSVMKTAIIPTDSGRQSVCSDDQSTSEAKGVQSSIFDSQITRKFELTSDRD